MASITDLANQYNSFKALNPINSSGEIKNNSKYRIFGTVENFDPTEGQLLQDASLTGRDMWRGKISLDYIIQGSGDNVKIAALFHGEDGQPKYYQFKQLLEGLNEEGVIEIGIKSGKRSRDQLIYMLIWKNEYFVRGFERTDFLQRFNYENALGMGLIKPPEDNGGA